MMNVMTTLKLWQLGVLTVVLLGTAGAVAGVFIFVVGSDDNGISDDQQLIPVQLGDLINQVSTSGSLVFPGKEAVTFGTRGTVGEVNVEVGDEVEAGQLLATLDEATVVSLEQAVAQAQISLKAAEDDLEAAMNPYTPLDVALTEAQVADTRLALRNAQEVLQDLLNPPTSELAAARTSLSNAEISLQASLDALEESENPSEQQLAQAEAGLAMARLLLQDAEDDLNSLLAPSPEEIARAELAVYNADSDVQDAEDALSEATNGPEEGEVADAQARVASADIALANAQGDLAFTTRDWEDRLAVAQDELETAEVGYEDIFDIWLGIPAGEINSEANPDQVLDDLNIDLTTLFDSGNRDQGVQAIPQDDPSTIWNETIVYLWLNAFPGPILATCDETEVREGTLCVRLQMEDTWDDLGAARENSEAVSLQASKGIASAESVVLQAEQSFAGAEEALADLVAGLDPLEIATRESLLAIAESSRESSEEDLTQLLQRPGVIDIAGLDLADLDPSLVLEADAKLKQVEVAEADLSKAERDLIELVDGPDPLEQDAMVRQVALAQAQLEEAEGALAKLEGDPDPLEVADNTNKVVVAGANLDRALEDLTELETGADSLAVALNESEVTSAQLALDTAVQTLEDASLRAPFPGLISLVNVEAGQRVLQETVIVEVVDPTIIEVDGIVDEIDVLFVRVGAEAQVTMDALPGQVLGGTVSSIASEPQNQQGVVTFPIRIGVQLPTGIQLVEGLSATANIVIQENSDVLLIPDQAIHGTFEQPLVLVMSNGKVQEQPVSLGNSDGFWTVVTAGLQEGDEVAIEITEANTDPFAQIRQQFQAGGRAGGGGGGFGGGGGGGFGGGGGGGLGGAGRGQGN